MKVIITGSSGRIGAALVAYFLEYTNYSLVLNYRGKDSIPENIVHNSRCEFVIGDIWKLDTIEELFSKGATSFVHLANDININFESWSKSLHNQTSGVLNIIDFLKSYKKKLHIIYPSSGGTVYSEFKGVPYKETDSCHGCSPYGIHKLLIENYLKLLVNFNKELSCNVLRISNPYGIAPKHSKRQGLVDILIDNLKKNKKMEIWSNPATIRDYIFIDDLTKAFKNSLEYKNGFEIFNIGSGVGTSINAVIQQVEKISRQKLDIVNSWRGEADFYPLYNVLDISKAQKKLNWTPQYAFAEGLLRCIDHNYKERT